MMHVILISNCNHFTFMKKERRKKRGERGAEGGEMPKISVIVNNTCMN